MDTERWRRVRALFDELAELPREARQDRLDGLFAEDAALHAEVLAMLDADQGGLFRTEIGIQAPDVLAGLADEADADQRQRLAGQRVGPFELLREIGQGGMGTVWLAQRVDGQFRQQVAVKLIRAGWDAGRVLERFRAERQILAGLTHPNIARLIDGGIVGQDRPWLALEYVEGVDIGRYCDHNRLSLPRRLRLFLTVCAAVSHAHARLVVHRDLKPSNLLVTADGVVKLLDFGIAKLIGEPSTQATATRVFTPEYAAPEQVRGETVTTAVDVYALGMILYELLTGRRPYETRAATPAACERAITELEPIRPSAAVTRGTAACDAESRAALRELSPERLRRELRGDLDAIVLKALRKDPAQRYASVADMAVDIENCLARRPVLARKGGWRYRTARFVRRHALAMGFAAVAALALAGGLAVALWQATEARAQRDLAVSQSGKAAQTVEFLLDIFRSADPAATQGRKVTAEELLSRAAARISRHSFDDAAVKFDLLVAMGEANLGIGATAAALTLFEQALALQESAFGGDRLKRARVLVALSRSQRRDDSALVAKRYLEEAARLIPAGADSELAAHLYVSRGINRLALGEIQAAIGDLERGVDLLRRLHGPGDALTASAAITLSWAYDDQDRLQDARELLGPIIAGLQEEPDANPVKLADALDAMANTYVAGSETAVAARMRREALEITRKIYGDDHLYTQIRRNNLAASLVRNHDYPGANTVLREALAQFRKLEPPGSARIGSTLNNLASIEYALGHWAEAERLWNEALEIRRKGDDVTDVAFSLTGAAGAARELGRLDDARVRIDEALNLLRAHPSPKPSHLARTLVERVEINLAQGVIACGLAEEAVALLSRTGASEDSALRLYTEVVAAGCARRAEDSEANRQRVVAAQRALRAEFPDNSARVRQAARYALPTRS